MRFFKNFSFKDNYNQMDDDQRQRFDNRVTDVQNKVAHYKKNPDEFKQDYIRGKQTIGFLYAVDPKTALKSLTSEYVNNLMSKTSPTELRSMASELIKDPEDISKREAFFGVLEEAQVNEPGYDPKGRKMRENLDLLEQSHKSLDRLVVKSGGDKDESAEIHKKIDAKKEDILKEKELRVPTLKYPYINQMHAFMDKTHVDELKKATSYLPASLDFQLKENLSSYNNADREKVDIENSIRLISSLADPEKMNIFMQKQAGESEALHLQRIKNLYIATDIVQKSADNLLAKYDLYIESQPELSEAFADLKKSTESVRNNIESNYINNNPAITEAQSKKEIIEEKLDPEHADYNREVNFSYNMMDAVPRVYHVKCVNPQIFG